MNFLIKGIFELSTYISSIQLIELTKISLRRKSLKNYTEMVGKKCDKKSVKTVLLFLFGKQVF